MNLMDHLERYLSCRQFAPHEQRFAQQVKQLQAWQVARLKETHKICLADPFQQQAAEFVLLDAYERLDVATMAPQLNKIVPYAQKLFPRSLLRVADLALALNALTAQLDQWLAEVLFEHRQLKRLTETDYIAAFIAVDGVHYRKQQLGLILELMQVLHRQAHNKMVLMSFKLAKIPAYSSGLQPLYDFMARGLSVMHAASNLDHLLKQIVEIEMALNEAIASGHLTPFSQQLRAG